MCMIKYFHENMQAGISVGDNSAHNHIKKQKNKVAVRTHPCLNPLDTVSGVGVFVVNTRS